MATSFDQANSDNVFLSCSGTGSTYSMIIDGRWASVNPVSQNGVEEDLGSLPRAGNAPDSAQFCMAVLQLIVDYAISLKTSEVWQVAFFTFLRMTTDLAVVPLLSIRRGPSQSCAGGRQGCVVLSKSGRIIVGAGYGSHSPERYWSHLALAAQEWFLQDRNLSLHGLGRVLCQPSRGLLTIHGWIT